MGKNSPTAELKNAIQLLEEEQDVKLKLMRKQFHQAYENLKPANLIKNSLKEISASPFLVNNLISTTIGLLTAYLSKKVITGKSNNKLRRFLGITMQLGITNIIAQNPKILQSFTQYISQYFSQNEK